MAVNRIGIKNADGQIVYTDISVKAENVRGKIAEAAVADKVAHTLTINGKAFDGSEDVSVTASGGGGDVGVEITQADYNALPEDEKMNGTTYFITDEQNISADNISYDNSATGLVAKTVQDAIDKIAKNGGGGAVVDPGVYLTQEEYDNLSEEEKNNGTLYYIEDTNDGEVRAANIRYEDNDGILEASNVQDAVDILAGKIVEITQAEYDLLTDEELKDKVYFITDGEGGSGGGSSTGAINLTQAEYDELSEEEKRDKIFFITDAENLDGVTLPYDNSQSGLEATNMQDAIDEISSLLKNTNEDYLVLRTETNGWNSLTLENSKVSDFSWIHVGEYEATYPNAIKNLCSFPVSIFKILFTGASAFFGHTIDNKSNFVSYIDENTVNVYKTTDGNPTVVIFTK